MSLWTLLRHRLRSCWRVAFFGRRALSLILGGFLALYLGGGLVLLGVMFDDIVREAVPGANPLLVASRWLLALGLLYAALRVFVELGLGTDPKPYQALPIRRSALAGMGAALALFSLWNAVPMAFVATACIEVETAITSRLGRRCSLYPERRVRAPHAPSRPYSSHFFADQGRMSLHVTEKIPSTWLP